jgi:uncharacterized protein with GYD domain
MPYYMLQAAYTPAAWAATVKSPQNRLEAVRPVVEKLGGKIEGGWLAFGEYWQCGRRRRRYLKSVR